MLLPLPARRSVPSDARSAALAVRDAARVPANAKRPLASCSGGDSDDGRESAGNSGSVSVCGRWRYLRVVGQCLADDDAAAPAAARRNAAAVGVVSER